MELIQQKGDSCATTSVRISSNKREIERYFFCLNEANFRKELFDFWNWHYGEWLSSEHALGEKQPQIFHEHSEAPTAVDKDYLNFTFAVPQSEATTSVETSIIEYNYFTGDMLHMMPGESPFIEEIDDGDCLELKL